MSTLPQSSNDPIPTSVPLTAPANGHIVCTSGTCGGKPCIDGTRIRVQDVVGWHERLGQSAIEIVHDFPQLKLSDVYAAMAYYYDHKAEIDADVEAARDYVEELKKQYPSKLRAKLDRDFSTDRT